MIVKSMKCYMVTLSAALIGMASSLAHAIDIIGAGATFPYPIYAKWAEAYKAKTGTAMNYQSIGSGGGIKQITARTVDFGASDKPLTQEELDKAGLMQFPAIIGGVVPIVNISGLAPNQLKLNGKVLAEIFMGKITKWNAPEIAALNTGLKLPAETISVVHRSDGSGTTFIFTNYLSKVSPEWKQKIGNDASVSWATGVGGKGNEGVAAYVQRIKGSIGYVEYAYAKQNKLSYALLRNRDGNFVAPDDQTFQNAAAEADWEKAPGFYEILTDEPGKNSWPITGASFILMHKLQDNPEKGKEVLRFFDWAYQNGDNLATELDYVPLPDKLINLVKAAWKTQIKDKANRLVWNQ